MQTRQVMRVVRRADGSDGGMQGGLQPRSNLRAKERVLLPPSVFLSI